MEQRNNIKYTLSFIPNHRQIEVKLVISCPVKKGQQFSMPSWTPGSYCMRDYAKFIISIKAVDLEDKKEVGLRKINNHTFVCDSDAKSLEVCYRLYANDASIRGCYCDHDRVFINGSAAFLRVHGLEEQEITIQFNQNDYQQSHQVATQLKSATKWGWDTYTASNYETLIDCPIAIADMEISTFEIEGVPHYIAFIGEYIGNIEKVTKDVTKICQTQAAVFSDSLPFESYLFLLHLAEDNYGGLEHCDSTALIAARNCLPNGENGNGKQYSLLLGLFSHEYFHAWHVKRIRPAILMKADLNVPAHTPLLWVFEGFTSYFDDLALVRSNVITQEEYFNLLLNHLARYTRGPGAKVQSLAESSFDAWTKFYYPHENSQNQGVSYYIKGAIVSLLLDMQIRLRSDNQKSLINVMQTLWQNYGKTGKGVNEGDVAQCLISLGIEEQFIKDAVYGCQDLPLEEIFTQFGLNISKAPLVQLDAKYPEATKPNTDQGFLGWQVRATDSALKITWVLPESPAANAGLWPKDEVVAINGFKTTKHSQDNLLKRLKAGQQIEVTFFRDNVLKNTTLTLSEPLFEMNQISVSQNLSPEAKLRIADWLNQPE